MVEENIITVDVRNPDDQDLDLSKNWTLGNPVFSTKLDHFEKIYETVYLTLVFRYKICLKTGRR